MKTWLLLLWGMATALTASPVPAPSPYIPSTLASWVDWVKDPQSQCSWLEGARLCRWPGPLQLNLSEQGGQFDQSWQLQADGWVSLPGDPQYWPEQVKVNDEPALVVEQRGRPMLWLKAGQYRIQGQFVWSALPERLVVPQEVVQLDVRLRQNDLHPRRDGELLLLGEEQPTDEPQADSLNLKVFRLLTQAVPLQLETRLELDVSGREREFSLAKVLPAGFQAVSLDSPLPGRLTRENGLELLLRPGHWSLRVQAVARQLPSQFEPPKVEGWPADEYWSFQSAPAQGLWQWSGADSVDPRQTEIPEEWRSLPAWLLTDKPLLLEQQPGSQTPNPSQLSLNRELWLDFDGKTFLVRDHLVGELGQQSRLDLDPPFQLLRAAQHTEDLLLTEHQQKTGIELRESSLNLDATSRLERSEFIGANGWIDHLNSASLRLHLPPGWTLLAVSGADDNSSWLLRWQLFDVFLALVIVMSAGKLLGWRYGAVALGLMLLSYQDSGAPVEIWLALLVFTALARLLPAGRWASSNQWLLNVSFLILAVQALPYSIDELRQALYPQLGWNSEVYQQESRLNAYQLKEAQGGVMMDSPFSPEPSMEVAADSVQMAMPVQSKLVERRLPAVAQQQQQQLSKPKINALTQTGPGLPDWTGDVYRFGLQGSVERDQQIQIWLMPPSLTRLLQLLKIALLAALVWGLLPGKIRRIRWSASLSLLPLVAMLSLYPDQTAQAEIPDAELLEQLASKVNAPPACASQCSSLPLAELTLAEQQLTLTLHLVAQVDTAWALPTIARAGQWRLDSEAAQILNQAPRALVRLPAGIHRLSFVTSAPSTELEIEFSASPLRVANQLPDSWQVQGLDRGRLQAGSLRLVPPQQQSQPGAKAERQWQSDIGSLVLVHRQLRLEQDWTLITRVQRLAPAVGAIRTSVPLLPGESILSADIRAERGQIPIQLSANQASIEWQSQLASAPELNWTASERPEQVERWQLSYASQWQLNTTGLTPVSDSADGQFRHQEFLPWPGQVLTLNATRPAAIAGSQLAIDSVLLKLHPGEQQEQVSLQFDYRSTKAGQHQLVLPAEMRLLGLKVDGQQQDFHLEQQRLWLSLLPGAHRVELALVRPLAAGSWYQSPVFDLGQPATNLRIELTPANKRWLLFSQGPQVGPAILFWGEFLMLLALALVFSRLHSPVKAYQWLLLAVGLSLSSWPVLLLLAFWFWSLERRQRLRPVEGRLWFNLRQLGLVSLTLVTLGALFSAIVSSLLSQPDMHILGNGSSHYQLNWFVDQSAGVLEQVRLLTVPVWLYRLILLVWALWLAAQLLRWLGWGWSAYSAGGFWRSKQKLLPAERPAE